MQVQMDRGDHPVLGPLDSPPLFSLTRSVGVLPDDGDVVAVPFLRTSATRLGDDRHGRPPHRGARLRRRPRPAGSDHGGDRARVPDARRRRRAEAGPHHRLRNSKFANNFFVEYLGNRICS
jgi:hypothetical protein